MSGQKEAIRRTSLASANDTARAIAPDLLKTIIECRKQIDRIIEDGAPTDWRMWRDDLDKLIAKATGTK